MLLVSKKTIGLFVWPLMASLAFAAQNKGVLKVSVVQGDGAFNDIKKKVAHEAVVEVRDESDHVVPNARVVFTAPSTGPGGSFADGEKTYIATTDAQGRATARGFTPNSTEGRFEIRVTASAGGRTGSGVVAQSNTLAGGMGFEPGGGSHKKTYILLGMLGGAAAGIILGVTHGGGTPTAVVVPPVPTTVSIGSITVGGPR